MGIPMGDNIHAPTIPSGPPSGGAHRDYSKLSMVDLMQEKERIESELSALSGVLSSVSKFDSLAIITQRKLIVDAISSMEPIWTRR